GHDPDVAFGHGGAVEVSSDAELVAALDAAGAADAMGRALEHGVVLGVVEAAEGAPASVPGQLLAQSMPRSGDAGATRAARAAWHRAVLAAHRASLVAACLRPELPRVLLHEALVRAHEALANVRAVALGKTTTYIVG